VLVAAGSLAACASGPRSTAGPTPEPSPADQALAGRTFLSVAVTENGADRPLVQGTQITLAFAATDLSASAGCNTMGGQYTVDGGRLLVTQLATTDIGCPAPLGAQDGWLAGVLGSKPTIVTTGGDLTLQSGTTIIRLKDRRVANPDRPLAGTLWTLESILTGDTAASIPGGVTATIFFKPDGTLTLFTGCNQGSASWTLVGPGIQVSDLVLTKKACAGADGEVEASMVAVLHAGTMSVTIQADSLTLQAGANGIQLRAL
jgi:heat shock protein HslJ